MSLSNADVDKLKSFRECFVETPLLLSIQEDFDRLRSNKQFAGEQYCMLLTGDAGTGKSFLIQHYMSKSPEQIGSGFIRKPLLVSRIPSTRTLESIIGVLLDDLGQWGSVYRISKSSVESLTKSLIKCLKRCETELIIIDQFHVLIQNETRERRNQIASHLKYISEVANIPIVLVGMPSAVKIAEDPEWDSKLLIRRSIPYFKLSNDCETFVRFIMGLAKRMPFATQPRLEAKHTIFALFASCYGCVRTLKYLLDESVTQALTAHSETLLHEHIGMAYAFFNPGQVNPFFQPIEEINTCEVQQYSRYEIDSAGKEEVLLPLQLTDKIPISQLLNRR